MQFGKVVQKFKQSAPYLGMLIDRQLNLKSAIRERTRLAKRNTWRIFNHSNHETGANPRTLLHILKSYILSILQYSAPCWIFKARTFKKMGSSAVAGYKRIWNELESVYNTGVKAALGVRKESADLAVLNIAGQWPLDYLLAYQSSVWYYKISHNLAGNALFDQYNHFKSNPNLWKQTTFYQPAHSFINDLDPTNELLNTKGLPEFKAELKLRINARLCEIWRNYDKASFTHSILPTWRNEPPDAHMYSKRASTRQMQMLTGHYPCNDRLYEIKKSATRQCRHGCAKSETIDHILLECDQFKAIRNKLMRTCQQLYIPFTTKNILTNRTIQPATQEYLHQISIG